MTDDARLLLKVLNVLQGMHYVRRMRTMPSQEKFARGWFARVRGMDVDPTGLAEPQRIITGFKQIFSITMGHEGGYSDDPDDPGGETYKGISRVFHPGWLGWAIVDHWKEAPPRSRDDGWLKEHESLQRQVRGFYRAQFWDTFRGDEVLAIAPEIAEELFDTGVNMSTERAVRFLQGALNVLNRQGQSWPDLDEDGLIGAKTLAALKVCCAS